MKSLQKYLLLILPTIFCFSCGSNIPTNNIEKVPQDSFILTTIQITKNPTTTDYFEGDLLDLTGLEVTAYYSDNSSKIITNYNVDLSGSLSSSDSQVTIPYQEGKISKSASFQINVFELGVVNFFIDTLPNKTSYVEGDTLDLTGIVTKVELSDGTLKTVSNYSPSIKDVLNPNNKEVVLYYSFKDNVFTDSFDIFVKSKELTKYDFNQKFPTKVPSIYISTDGTSWVTSFGRNDKLANRIDYVSAAISTVDETNSNYNISEAVAKVKVRGNYTLDYPKKPIRIKFDKKQTMFGLNDDCKAKSWVLLAEWKDLSMLNNTTAFYLANRILGSDGLYNTDYMNVKVYINNQYWGLYLLAEQQEVKEGRFSLTTVEDDSTLELGYLMELDGYYNLEDPANGGDYTFEVDYGDFSFKTQKGLSLSKEDFRKGYTLKSDTFSDAQRDQISNYMSNVYQLAYNAIHLNKFYKLSDDYSTLVPSQETDPYKVISRYINIDSWVDMYIISELACDPDLGGSSFYMDCDLNHNSFKPLTFEGCWDYDSAFGIRTCASSNKGYFALNNSDDTYNPWFIILNGCSWFKDLVKAKWLEIFNAGVLDDTLENILEHKKLYKDYYEENYERWPSRITNGNFEVVSDVNVNHDEGDGADYLYNWLNGRISELHTLFTGESILDKQEKEAIEFTKNATKYRFELENGDLHNCIAKTGYNSSNNGYVGEFANSAGNFVEFSVNSLVECDCVIYVGCAKRTTESFLSNFFDIKINNASLALFDTVVPACDLNDDWHDFDVYLACKTHLDKGKNNVKIISINGGGTNIDCMDFYAKNVLTFE